MIKGKKILLYTDGACWGNPGVGGWGYVLKDSSENMLIEGKGAESYTTNNRMEMMAVMQGLEKVYTILDDKERGGEFLSLELYTDSQYVKNGIEVWRHGWKKKNFMKEKDLAIKNRELWIRMDSLFEKLPLPFQVFWVKGHSGHPENERCDQLATKAIEELLDLERLDVNVKRGKND